MSRIENLSRNRSQNVSGSHIENLSRRGFLKDVLSGSAFVLGVYFAPGALRAAPLAAETPADRAAFHPNVFLGIETDGTVYIIAHRSEMGNGSRTTLPRVLADELDADWNRVKVVQAVGDPRYGGQDTDASQSIRVFFDAMRETGATARLTLVRAAAAQWSVPVSECESGLHVILHSPTGSQLTYGELALAATRLPVPKREDVQLKPRSAWRYIGKDANLYDLEDICTWKATYGMDARIDGMVYASVERPPVLGGKVKSYQDQEASRVPGVRQTVLVEPFKPPHGMQPLGGVAVIADNTWAAFQGRKKLRVDWDHGPNAAYNSAQFKKELQQTARHPGKVMRNEGDVDTEFAKGGKTLDAEYYVPHLAHATMEPPVAVADFRDGKVSVWAPTEDPQGVGPHEGARLSVKQPPPVRRVMQGLHRAARVWSATWSFSPRRTVERPVPPPMATTFISHSLKAHGTQIVPWLPPSSVAPTGLFSLSVPPSGAILYDLGWTCEGE